MSSVFRTALQVSQEVVSNLDETGLTTLMRELLHDHAYRCGAPVSKVIVNTEEKAKDGGCDAWSPAPPQPDEWFGDGVTCWQLKAGVAGQPAKLSGEIAKKIPSDTLKNGGRVVVVASGSTNGTDGERERLNKLHEEARAAGLPADRIDVIGSERLTTWCNQHPAVAARFTGAPEGLWLVDKWGSITVHRVRWQSTPEREADLARMRGELDLASGGLLHLHIQGHPGVGKSRFALELCKEAPWKGSVVYMSDASDLPVRQVIEGAVAKPEVRLVLVADEIQRNQLEPLRDALDAGEGRVRLITIGDCHTPDPTRIPALVLTPLDDQSMRQIVSGWHTSMPREHVEFVTRFADGYVRLAQLASDAVARNPQTDVRGILDQAHIRSVLDDMLQGANRRALHVVAILRSVGWRDDKEVEGKTIAAALGLDWNDVCASVEEFDRRHGIAPRGGRYRYISPTPLGIHLAIEAWNSYPTALRELPDKLPTEEAKAAYYDRLQEIADTPHAKKFAREELACFFRVTNFTDPWAARRWAALSAADPALAANKLAQALLKASVDERAAIRDRARREVVHRLVLLAWNSASFYDATLSLALLGEAENESWGNNATGEFIARFEVMLGGTPVPYVERLAVLDEILSFGRAALHRLVIKALARVNNQHGTRTEPGGPANAPREKEWHPRTGLDVLSCREQAIGRLTTIARNSVEELQVDLVRAAKELSMLLRQEETREMVATFYAAIREKHPGTREALRRIVADILYSERKYWNDLPEAAVAKIDAIHASLEDHSLDARLHQFVGPGRWERDEPTEELAKLAAELVSNRDELERGWPWLTSGNAGDAWRFGEALATADADGTLDEALVPLGNRGPDLRAVCGFVSKRREQRGEAWFDTWVEKTFTARPDDWPLLFELSWRCGVTVTLAHIISKAVREKAVPQEFTNQLENGAWPSSLPPDSLNELLATLSNRGHRRAAVAILEHRLKALPADLGAFEAVALEVVTSGDVIRDGAVMTDYYWKKVALRLVPRHAQAIVAAILREQADRTADTWFAEFSTAKEVLWKCVDLNPTAVWEALKPHLSSYASGFHFAVGFPLILDQLPAGDVASWVAEKPEERARIIARLVNKNLADDETLTARLLGAFGDSDVIGSTFFSAYTCGAWTGLTSEHWGSLAAELERVARTTRLPKLRRWSAEAARGLREMQERDAEREAEEQVRDR
jgi:hypothetical protein